ncbi:MAG: hypothetical protein GYA24_21750 [Candidatus Lokiarchaeota archaeon]|nr:hypothetical protein [Candidatus Lokiarchaeota archaeon]
METLDEVGALFKQLEDAEYYNDAVAINRLSRQIHDTLDAIGETMVAEPSQRVDAANVFLSSAEVIQPVDFHAAVQSIKRALHVLGEAAATARKAGDLKQAADIYKRIGDVHAEILGDAITARQLYLSVIDCHETSLAFSETVTKPANETLYNQYYSLAELHFIVSNWQAAERHARVAIEASKKAGKYYMVATSYKLLLQVAHEAGDKGKLLATFYEARDYFEALLATVTGQEKKANFMEIAEIYHVFASFYDLVEDVGDSKEAFVELSTKEAGCYVDVAKDYERQGDDIGSALHYHSAGLVLKRIRDFLGARSAFERSGRHYEAAGEFDAAAENYIEASNCMERDNEFLETIKYIQQANALYEKAGFIEVVVANCYRALDVHDYLVPGNTILRPALVKMLTGALAKLAKLREDSGEHRDAAQFTVELAHTWFQEKNIDRSMVCLRKALDLLKTSHLPGNDSNAAACNDMLAIVIIALVLERDDDVTTYIERLHAESMKSAVGRDYASVAWQLAMGSSGDEQGMVAASRSRVVFNNPILRNLFDIWIDVHSARARNQ